MTGVAIWLVATGLADLVRVDTDAPRVRRVAVSVAAGVAATLTLTLLAPDGAVGVALVACAATVVWVAGSAGALAAVRGTSASLIVALGLGGAATAAAVVVAAKGLLRFPELGKQDDDGPSELTEYFLIGSMTSWLFALGGVALVALERSGG